MRVSLPSTRVDLGDLVLVGVVLEDAVVGIAGDLIVGVIRERDRCPVHRLVCPVARAVHYIGGRMRRAARVPCRGRLA